MEMGSSYDGHSPSTPTPKPSQGCSDEDGVLAGWMLGVGVVVGEGLALFAHVLPLCGCRTSSSSAGPTSKRRDPPSPSSWTCWRNCQSATVAFPTPGTSGSQRSKSLPLPVLPHGGRHLCLRSSRPHCHSQTAGTGGGGARGQAGDILMPCGGAWMGRKGGHRVLCPHQLSLQCWLSSLG